jgi:hypothetical protein
MRTADQSALGRGPSSTGTGPPSRCCFLLRHVTNATVAAIANTAPNATPKNLVLQSATPKNVSLARNDTKQQPIHARTATPANTPRRVAVPALQTG